MLEWLAVFGLGIVVDLLAIICFHFTSRNRTYMAATTNVALTSIALFAFVDVSRRPMIAVPYLAGLWIGGVIGMKLKKRFETRL